MGLSVACGGEPSAPPSVPRVRPTATSSPSAQAPAPPEDEAPIDDLHRLIAMSLDPHTTIDTFTARFGPATLDHNRHYRIQSPFPGARDVELERHTHQNRELISAVQVHFRKDEEPSVAALAARLGIVLPTTTLKFHYGCTHGGCPRIAFNRQVPDRADQHELSFELLHERHELFSRVHGRDDYDHGQATNLRVEELRYNVLDVTCPIGRPAPESEPLVAPQSAEQKRLAAAVLQAATTLAGSSGPFDTSSLEQEVGDLFQVRTSHSPTRVKVDLYGFKPRTPMPPTSIPGLDYVEDHQLICRIWGDRGTHLFELATSDPNTRVIVSLSSYSGPRISRIIIERVPTADHHAIGI